jgi:CRP-like cAMP-binding protein
MNVIAPATDDALRTRAAVRMPWPALLGPLSSDDAAALDALAVARHVPEGRMLFERGRPAHTIVALIDGQAACGWAQPPRGLSPERVLHGPAWLVLAAPLGDRQHACDALAQGPLQLADLPVEPLRALLMNRPVLAWRFIEALAREVGRQEARLHGLMHKDAGARLASWLVAQTDGRTQAVLRLAERKRDIASQLGMTPETLSRMMRSLSERGLIDVSGYTVRVLDPAALQGLAGG